MLCTRAIKPLGPKNQSMLTYVCCCSQSQSWLGPSRLTSWRQLRIMSFTFKFTFKQQQTYYPTKFNYLTWPEKSPLPKLTAQPTENTRLKIARCISSLWDVLHVRMLVPDHVFGHKGSRNAWFCITADLSMFGFIFQSQVDQAEIFSTQGWG